jgi:hypothetical protein
MERMFRPAIIYGAIFPISGRLPPSHGIRLTGMAGMNLAAVFMMSLARAATLTRTGYCPAVIIIIAAIPI